MSIIGDILDDYAVPARVEMFLWAQNQDPGKTTPEEVDLLGGRAILASEPAVTDTFSGKKIKAVTDSDKRTARFEPAAVHLYEPRNSRESNSTEPLKSKTKMKDCAAVLFSFR